MKYQYKIVHKICDEQEQKHNGFHWIYYKPAGWLGILSPWSFLGLEYNLETAKKRISNHIERIKFKPIKKLIEIIKP